MTTQAYDAVIVGGRCSGAALATYLARSGASVVVLEADDLGADQVISTHTIHPAGMDILDELGVGEAVRSKSPPARVVRFEVNGVYVDIEPPPGRHECCPRRYRLDGLLQEAAMQAGAEFRPKTRVTDLIFDGERVAGVHATQDGQEVEVRGAITVGADGRRSTVASLVGAEEYLDYDSPRGMFWAYWEPPQVWQEPEYPYDILLRFEGNDRRVVFSTDDGQLLIGTLPLIETARGWRSDLEAAYLADLRSDPDLAALTDGGGMTSKVLGTVSERYFFRRAAGPGWALLGDAGHHKDPLIGWGISEALHQAKQLAAAIQAGGDAAVERYWRRRDVEALPRFRLAEDRGAPGSLSPLMPIVLRRLPGRPDLAQRMFRETEIEVNPYDLMPVPKVALWTLMEALKGRPGLLKNFIATGKRASAVASEVKRRRKLVEATNAS